MLVDDLITSPGIVSSRVVFRDDLLRFIPCLQYFCWPVCCVQDLRVCSIPNGWKLQNLATISIYDRFLNKIMHCCSQYLKQQPSINKGPYQNKVGKKISRATVIVWCCFTVLKNIIKSVILARINKFRGIFLA